MEAMTIVIGIAGLILGGVIGWLVQQSRASKNTEMMRSEMERLRLGAENSEVLKNELASERSQVMALTSEHSALQADYRNLQERLTQQKTEVEELQNKFTAEFTNLANKIFEEKSKKFTEQNRSNIGDLLNPLKERIQVFEQRVDRNNKDTQEWNARLKEQLHHLKELNVQVTKEAENLTRALRGDSKTQGSWGEMQLEAILEKTGLEKGIHYETEKNFKSEEGKNQRLDFIIKLPDDKSIVLDSKVSLTAYTQYFEAEEADKDRILKKHLDSIYGHIKLLSEKNYQNLYEINQPDYVMMFVANEPALTIALKEDPGLYEKALDKNIVLVSTSTLVATLRTISYIWKQDMQNRNAVEIARQAGNLYDKFTSFTEDLLKVGRNLKTTQGVYEEAMNKLVDGRGNIVGRVEKLKDMGAKATKQLDKKLVDRASDKENLTE
jgi:DNA recombination protein RmuC